MPVLVITTAQGATHEAEVRDFHDANHEIARFNQVYLANHPNDRIIDASVVAGGSIISRFRGEQLEDF